MAKHTSGATCPACDEKLKTADPELARIYRDVIKPRFYDCHISDAWRGERAQNEHVAMGKSRLRWPLSKHNAFDDNGNPCSQALDLFELASNGMACWRWVYFKAIAQELDAEGLPIRWGGDWNGNGRKDKDDFDSPHFELVRRATSPTLGG